MNDADIETARLTETANRLSALERKGTCTHGSLKTDPGTGRCRCTGCGKTWASFDEAADEHASFF